MVCILLVLMLLEKNEFIQYFELHLYIFTSSSKCITTGYLIDRVFGIRLGATIFAALIAGGKIVALNKKFWKETI